jgi:Lipocalin-like domain
MGTKMSNDSARQHLFGTWKLITAVREEISTGTKTQFLGPNPVGYINYGPDGRMLVLTVGSGRPKPAARRQPPPRWKRCFAA